MNKSKELSARIYGYYDFNTLQSIWLLIQQDKDENKMHLWTVDEHGTRIRKSDDPTKTDIWLGADFIRDLQNIFGDVFEMSA